ncbi:MULTISPECIES: hypothetical protein [unclassified Aureimonas]|uniref:hypothetical protein n=1 Tax=unclassified Aureimonas TaxID=2615206 RepID=UPI0006FD053D|nr:MULTISPECIES: hypothetical protein [unclassified Aureimonas]KQT52281.1 hypothetical protein ASG62_16640 [Aureimonas sp. Leaf427]KQT61832.1 hypothetical protein ASG54_23705 [Aureimonas sp. Leaf460]
MSTVQAITRLLGEGLPVTLEAVGGLDAVRRDAEDLARSPYLDVLAEWAAVAARDDQPFTDELLLSGFANTIHPLGFRGASDTLLSTPTLCSRIATKLDGILETRAAERDNDREGFAAARALEVALRLSLANAFPPYRLFTTLCEITPNENGLFAEHAAKIAGVAFHTWRDDRLLRVLDTLRMIAEARVEATFEYGNALMSVALDGTDRAEVIGGLEAARVLFGEAHELDADRSDALLYASVIDVARAFDGGDGVEPLERAVGVLSEAAADRAFLLSAGRLPDWLVARRDRDVQWHELLEAVPRLASDLERKSWYKASEVLGRLLRVYDAERTVPGGEGLSMFLRPRIEAAFVRREALLAHLDDLLDDAEFVGDNRGVAAKLRGRIEAMAGEPQPPGKSGEDVLTGELRDVLGDIEAPPRFTEELLAIVRAWVGWDVVIANPVVQRLYSSLRGSLAASVDYVGTVRTTFDALVLQVICFCAARQDAASSELGQRGAYLFDPSAHESGLQQDLHDFLAGNLHGAGIQTEVEGIAKGRADIYVGHGGWRFLIELKRHKARVTRKNATKYVGQAASYQNTNVKLGMLGVLELVQKRTGLPSALEECIWYDTVLPKGDTSVRHLVVFKVPGNMMRPNRLSK